MRYFLVSVRGTIDRLDEFQSPSMLFSDTPDEYDELQRTVSVLLEQFKGPFGTGESAIDWDGVYGDRRFQSMALSLIEALRRKVEAFGLEQYVGYLESYRKLDPQNSGLNAMYRPFGLEDAQQLDEALGVAESALWQMTH